MLIRRRQLIVALSSLLACSVANGQLSPLDAVPIYLVPLDDFPEDLASALAKSLQQNLNFRIKASLKLPPLPIPVLPGTNQLVAEEILLQAAKASARLPEANATTYRLFLTGRDINGRSANFRFQYSVHSKAMNCSVVSVARLLDYSNERPVLTQVSIARLLKLTKRAIGEMYLGWTRSADPKDLMYSPLMSLDDLDHIGLDHAIEPKEKQQPVPPKAPENAV